MFSQVVCVREKEIAPDWTTLFSTTKIQMISLVDQRAFLFFPFSLSHPLLPDPCHGCPFASEDHPFWLQS
jgi:hypothetical protein